MLIDNIDFAALYQQQLALAKRTEKTPAHWDKRAQKMASICTPKNDPYLSQLLAAIDLRGAQTLLDVGCGPGTVCLSLAARLSHVYGIDYSPGMLQLASQRARESQLTNVTLLQRAWSDSWHDLPPCDIAVASRSTLVDDLRRALAKLNQHARLHVYTTHPVNTTFVDKRILSAIGREILELPNYIYAVNILYQMGIHAQVSFIRAGHCPPQSPMDFRQFADGISWSLGGLSDDEHQRLHRYYQHALASNTPLTPSPRDWALVHWQPQS